MIITADRAPEKVRLAEPGFPLHIARIDKTTFAPPLAVEAALIETNIDTGELDVRITVHLGTFRPGDGGLSDIILNPAAELEI